MFAVCMPSLQAGLAGPMDSGAATKDRQPRDLPNRSLTRRPIAEMKSTLTRQGKRASRSREREGKMHVMRPSWKHICLLCIFVQSLADSQSWKPQAFIIWKVRPPSAATKWQSRCCEISIGRSLRTVARWQKECCILALTHRVEQTQGWEYSAAAFCTKGGSLAVRALLFIS